MAISPITYFESPDTFLRTMSFLNPKDIFYLERVCKSWEKAVIDLRVLEDFFEAENIPIIEGRRPNYKAYVVLRGMFERGVSVEKIRKYFGEPVGNMPQISQEKYELMLEPDPEDPKKMMFETYEAVVIPIAVKRIFGKNLVASLDTQGVLKIAEQDSDSSSEEYELEIPFSFSNLAELSGYSLAGQKNVHFSVYGKVLDQCQSQAVKLNIYFMRTNILEKSRSETYSQQEARVKRLNQEFVPLIVRAVFLSTMALENQEWPDLGDGWSGWRYSRTADRVSIGNDTRRVYVGSVVPGNCINAIYCGDNYANSGLGVAPGVPAEA